MKSLQSFPTSEMLLWRTLIGCIQCDFFYLCLIRREGPEGGREEGGGTQVEVCWCEDGDIKGDMRVRLSL